MAEVLLFHHALGRTTGVEAFADELRRAGHVVHVPDLFDGRTFATLEEGVADVTLPSYDANAAALLTKAGARLPRDSLRRPAGASGSASAHS